MGGYGVVLWGYRGVYGVQLHGVTTGWRCEESLGGYGVVLWGYRGIYGLQLHGATTGWRCEVSMGVMGWFYGVIGGSMGCNYTV